MSTKCQLGTVFYYFFVKYLHKNKFCKLWRVKKKLPKHPTLKNIYIMMKKWNAIFGFIAMMMTLTPALAVDTCPPTGFDAVSTLDLDGFVEARWYSAKQLPVQYQPRSQFYCVYASYTKITKKSAYCRLFGCTDPPSIKVFNSARRKSVTGSINSITFGGTITDVKNNPAKVKVTLGLIPRLLRRGSNYWVVARGKYADLGLTTPVSSFTYDYAIITSGSPKKKADDGGCYSSGGMWIFTRDAVPPAGAIDAIEVIAKGLGLSTSVWLPVTQAGCTY